MAQLTIRLDNDLAREVKTFADERGRSVNSWVVSVLRAAVDPEYADSETERTRGRLARAGLLATPAGTRSARRPDSAAVAAARAQAGHGPSLSALVADERD